LDVISIQMDAHLEKEQIGTLFVWVGAPEGGERGGWGVQGVPTQKVYMPVQNFFFGRLLAYYWICAIRVGLTRTK
jgi:hypothetical protein